MATPQPMFDPARLCTTLRPSRSRIAATIADVVVLPLVADTSTAPWSRRRAIRSIDVGVGAQQQPAREGGAAAAAEAA